jgi:hypothetical protein
MSFFKKKSPGKLSRSSHYKQKPYSSPTRLSRYNYNQIKNDPKEDPIMSVKHFFQELVLISAPTTVPVIADHLLTRVFDWFSSSKKEKKEKEKEKEKEETEKKPSSSDTETENDSDEQSDQEETDDNDDDDDSELDNGNSDSEQ